MLIMHFWRGKRLMTEFFEAQIDYIFFFYGLGFMVLGTLLPVVLDRRGQQGVYW